MKDIARDILQVGAQRPSEQLGLDDLVLATGVDQQAAIALCHSAGYTPTELRGGDAASPDSARGFRKSLTPSG